MGKAVDIGTRRERLDACIGIFGRMYANGGPIFLPPVLYAEAKALGYDMEPYQEVRPIPLVALTA